ncbi:MAG: hypothetical protein IJY62_02440 [Clostridia bacterium]|nr:hypothetical protein [Clostridia bacterium]
MDKTFLFPLRVKRLFRLFFLLLATLLFALCFSACSKETDYFSFVSENRSNIFLCKTEDFSLKIHAVERENPYSPDGVPRESSPRTEVFLIAAETTDAPVLTLIVNGKEFGGDMSFDNAKAEYYYSCTLDVSHLASIPVRLEYKGTMVETNAVSVKTQTSLSSREILFSAINAEREKINTLTDKNGFAGEFYIRLISEDGLYYYVGIIDRNGKVLSMLLSAESGKVLAKREA